MVVELLTSQQLTFENKATYEFTYDTFLILVKHRVQSSGSGKFAADPIIWYK